MRRSPMVQPLTPVAGHGGEAGVCPAALDLPSDRFVSLNELVELGVLITHEREYVTIVRVRNEVGPARACPLHDELHVRVEPVPEPERVAVLAALEHFAAVELAIAREP